MHACYTDHVTERGVLRFFLFKVKLRVSSPSASAAAPARLEERQRRRASARGAARGAWPVLPVARPHPQARGHVKAQLAAGASTGASGRRGRAAAAVRRLRRRPRRALVPQLRTQPAERAPLGRAWRGARGLAGAQVQGALRGAALRPRARRPVRAGHGSGGRWARRVGRAQV